MGHLKKVFMELATPLPLHHALGFRLQGIRDPTPGIEPTPPTLEGKVPITAREVLGIRVFKMNMYLKIYLFIFDLSIITVVYWFLPYIYMNQP